jgi:hypothetical protein
MSDEIPCVICEKSSVIKLSRDRNSKKYITLCKLCYDNGEKMRNVLISLLQDCYVSYTMFDNVQQAIMEHRIPLEHKYDGE